MTTFAITFSSPVPVFLFGAILQRELETGLTSCLISFFLCCSCFAGKALWERRILLHALRVGRYKVAWAPLMTWFTIKLPLPKENSFLALQHFVIGFYEVAGSARSPVTGVDSVSSSSTRDLRLALRFRAVALTSYQKQVGKDLEGLPCSAPAAMIYHNLLQRLNQQG